jgi:hypothetical protein
MSRSCNASALLQMEQKLEQQTQRQQSDLLVVQKEIEAIQVQQLKQGEQILEANGNIADVRSWQTNMGQKFIESQTTLSVINYMLATLVSIFQCTRLRTEFLLYFIALLPGGPPSVQ